MVSILLKHDTKSYFYDSTFDTVKKVRTTSKRLLTGEISVIHMLSKKKKSILFQQFTMRLLSIKSRKCLIAEANWENSLFCLKLYVILPVTQSHLEQGKNSITKLQLS